MEARQQLALEFRGADLGVSDADLLLTLDTHLATAQAARPDATPAQITAEVRAALLRLQIRHVTRQLSRKKLGDVETQRDLKVQLAELRTQLSESETASGLIVTLPRKPAHSTGRPVVVG